MRPILVKVYGNLYPVNEECFLQCEKVLSAWNIENIDTALSFEKDMLQFSFEGDYFPCDEISEILIEIHNKSSQTQGKLDCINIEDWTLTRHFFNLATPHRVNTASLNNALEKQTF